MFDNYIQYELYCSYKDIRFEYLYRAFEQFSFLNFQNFFLPREMNPPDNGRKSLNTATIME